MKKGGKIEEEKVKENELWLRSLSKVINKQFYDPGVFISIWG